MINTNRQIKAIGFDIGGTLMFNDSLPLNWEELYRPTFQRLFSQFGISPIEPLLENAVSILSEYNTWRHPRNEEIPSKVIFSRIISELNLDHVIKRIEFEDTFFRILSNNSARLFDDTMPALTNLVKHNIKIGYLSDVAYGQTRLADSALEKIYSQFRCFSNVLLTSVDVGYRKTTTKGFFMLADKLQCHPHAMAYVGDLQTDVTGAKKAGMLGVLIKRNGEVPDWGQDITIKSLDELFDCLNVRPCKDVP